jgi:hypothetical protein
MNTESITWWDLTDELAAMLWNPGRLIVTNLFHTIVTQATHDRLGENRLVLRVGDDFDLHVHSLIDMTDDVIDLWIFKPRPVQIDLRHLENRRALYTFHFESGVGLTRAKLKRLSLTIRDMLRGLPDYPTFVEHARRPRLEGLLNRLLDSDEGVLARKSFAQRNAAFARIESSLLNEI